jgi:hypothetical protein
MEAIKKFDIEAGQYLNMMKRPPVPDVVYHYTDAAGLFNILESGKFWLSDVQHLNDTREIAHGFSVACDKMIEACEGQPPNWGEFFSPIASARDELLKELHFHACCFTSEGNDLGQWRAYGANGRGFAIGFNATSLGNRIVESQKRGERVRGFAVSYDDKLLHERASAIVDLVKPCLPLTPAEGADIIDLAPMHLRSRLTGVFLNVALHHKEPFFSAEREYRILEILNAPAAHARIKKRLRGMTFIPYSEFQWSFQHSALPLQSITIGPANEKQGAKEFVDECLSRFKERLNIADADLAKVQVVHSGKPYRA